MKIQIFVNIFLTVFREASLALVAGGSETKPDASRDVTQPEVAFTHE